MHVDTVQLETLVAAEPLTKAEWSYLALHKKVLVHTRRGWDAVVEMVRPDEYLVVPAR